jgi:formate dehydrogenase subunit beta
MMATQWMLETNGDPLGSIQLFLRDIWPNAAIDGILLPLRTAEERDVTPQLIDSPDQLDQADPFAPIMRVNAAQLVAELTHEYPFNSFAAVLRPCEMRALVEMLKHNAFQLDRVLLIGIECLATFPSGDFEWRSGRKKGLGNLTNEVLQFARMGGIWESRYRSACQMCENPTPEAVDIGIHVIGLPVNDFVLISVQDDKTAEDLHLPEITIGKAGQTILDQRNFILDKLSERRQKVRRQNTIAMDANLPRDLDELINWMVFCEACTQCLDACPICSVVFPRKEADGKYLRQDVIRWLISCADCGMCEAACPDDKPLAAIFGNIRRELESAYQYTAGQSFSTPLPSNTLP